jgi:hypothetical protein
MACAFAVTACNAAPLHADGDTLHLALDGAVFAFTEPSPYPKQDTLADPSRARAPVAGVVASVRWRWATAWPPASRWSAWKR